jgi:phage protein D
LLLSQSFFQRVSRHLEYFLLGMRGREHANIKRACIKRGAAKMDFALSLGCADLLNEQKLSYWDFKPEIGDTAWLITKVTQSIASADGFTTHIELETDVSTP